MTQPDWDDDRLDAAFHARFDRPAPTGLAQDVHVRIAGTSPARFGGMRLRPAWSAAIAAVVVVAVAGTALIGLGTLGRSGGSPLGSAASTGAPDMSATPTEQVAPGAVFGLPIIRVADAIAIRDAGVDDREFAVQGWFTPAPPANCGPGPSTDTINPLPMRCGDDLVWLTEEPESLVVMTRTEVETRTPRSPALHPSLAGLQTDWFPTLPKSGAGGELTPVRVVLVGHFDDRRADQCQDAEIAACRDRFVVDAVASVDGVEQTMSHLRTTIGVRLSDAAIAAIIANEAPDSTILSTSVLSAQDILDFEPSLANGQAGLVDQRAVWIVRVLESERVVTYIVIDGSDAIYEMNPDGDAILVGGEPPAPEVPASPTVWPPVASRVVTLTSEVGAGAPPVQVAVVDKSGRLEALTEKGAVDPATISFDGRFGAYPEPGHPGRVHLTWIGGICDSQITVTVAQDLGSISFDLGPQPACDSIGIGRELVLDFSGLVDVPSIELVDATGGTPQVGSDPPGPTVDCGPLGPDTCETRTAAVIAATPEKRIVSIDFLDECGSYTVAYEDGSGVTASIDCIPGSEPS